MIENAASYASKAARAKLFWPEVKIVPWEQ
jgi:hypothetical protein